MANVVNLQVLENGPKWYIVKGVGLLDTSNVAKTTLVDTTAAAFRAGFNNVNQIPFTLIVKEMEFAVQPPLSVNLYWNATADILFAALSGYGKLCTPPGILNNSGAGKDGVLEYETTGWTAGTVSYTFTLKGLKAFS